MSNIIEDFYYGNIEPQEVNTELTPKLKKKLSKLAEKEEQLIARLNGEDKELFATLLTEGKLYQHCAEIGNQARNIFDTLIEQMKNAEGVAEQLKEKNKIKWICRMQSIGAKAHKITRRELICA